MEEIAFLSDGVSRLVKIKTSKILLDEVDFRCEELRNGNEDLEAEMGGAVVRRWKRRALMRTNLAPFRTSVSFEFVPRVLSLQPLF